MKGLDALHEMWMSVRKDDEEQYPEVTGCPNLPPAIKDITYWLICIAGETAEMLNLIKKRWRNGRWDPNDQEVTKELVKESIDVLIYFVELYEELGVDEEYVLEVFRAKKYELHCRWSDLPGECECAPCKSFRKHHDAEAVEIENLVIHKRNLAIAGKGV